MATKATAATQKFVRKAPHRQCHPYGIFGFFEKLFYRYVFPPGNCGCIEYTAEPRDSRKGMGTMSETSKNKKTIEKYMDGFNGSNHAQILSCLTDDVEWELPGFFHLKGKAAFDKEIENDAFVGSPTITVTRMIEEEDVVVAEGTVRSKRKDGGVLNAAFCDVFVMKNTKIRRLTSYLAELKQLENLAK